MKTGSAYLVKPPALSSSASKYYKRKTPSDFQLPTPAAKRSCPTEENCSSSQSVRTDIWRSLEYTLDRTAPLYCSAVVIRNALNEPEMQMIHNCKDRTKKPDGKYQGRGKSMLRKAYGHGVTNCDQWVTWIDGELMPHPLYTELLNITIAADEAAWQYYDGAGLKPRCVEYIEYTKGSYVDWHRDDGTLYTLILYLTDPKKYKGGALQLRDDPSNTKAGNVLNTYKLNKGDIVVFLGEVMHQVTPVTSGDRDVLVIELKGSTKAHLKAVAACYPATDDASGSEQESD